MTPVLLEMCQDGTFLGADSQFVLESVPVELSELPPALRFPRSLSVSSLLCVMYSSVIRSHAFPMWNKLFI